VRCIVLLATLQACSCGEPCLEPLADDAAYADDDAWLCLPGGDDACAGAPRATELLPDGSTAVVDVAPIDDPPVDCFYVYPTVNAGLSPGLESTDAPTNAERSVAAAQAALYQEACTVSAPLYRQMSIGTYGKRVDVEVQERCFAVATSDVQAAFRAFLDRIGGDRRYAVVSHSQGSHHVQRLLDDVIEEDDALLDRLLVAHVIGGALTVEKGTATALDRVPACTAPDETGCIVAYRSFPTGHPGPDPGTAFASTMFDFDPDVRELACVAPTVDGVATRSLLPTTFTNVDADEKYVLVRDRYAVECARSGSDQPFLRVSVAEGDDVLDLSAERWQGTIGTHVVDMGLVAGDLVDDVARRAAAQ
jgi:hypothetical protein